LQYASRQLPNGKFGWRYDLEIREQRRRGTAPPAADLWPSVRTITCPTLVVRGAETDTLSPEVAQQMEQTLAQGKLVEVPRAGHMVFEDNPDDFIAKVTAFLK
jgi:pimeloyl-ACP methyl ester carboxylesterase